MKKVLKWTAIGIGGLIVLLVIIGAIVGSPKKTTTTNASVPTNTESAHGQTSAGGVTTSQTSQQAKHHPKAAKPTPPQPQPDPKAVGYIKAHNDDLNTVNADITLAELALIPAVKSASGVNLEKLAEAAQKAHDNMDGIRDDFAANTTTDTSSTVGEAEVNIWAAANDLKNSMGQLVAVAGSPDPETVAKYKVQFEHGQQEWNSGVKTIWRLARQSQHDAPTI